MAPLRQLEDEGWVRLEVLEVRVWVLGVGVKAAAFRACDQKHGKKEVTCTLNPK